MAEEEGWSNPWPGFFIMAMGGLCILIGNIRLALMNEDAEKSLKAEKIYSKWLQDRLNKANNLTQQDVITIDIHHIIVPKGPIEEAYY